MELSTGYQFAPDWRINANYTYTDSEQKSGDNKGEPLTDTPEHAINATLRWQTTAKLYTWLSAEYRSERYRNRESVRGAPRLMTWATLKPIRCFTWAVITRSPISLI
ncbi:hypothetical protein HORIV_50960 [Vreelandella olivaria]|uniref:TonB-dependent receptor-like beta-barrel domain-containing protein n=1 Tax=Vreelandella olivaria TaxID=390919 RepID=A0ABM7GPM8_9GAMM|nr:hypothetical protein HORIV_50960 [Halomonas olivaria]